MLDSAERKEAHVCARVPRILQTLKGLGAVLQQRNAVFAGEVEVGLDAKAAAVDVGH
jgi:hypothetical protein